MSKFIATHYNKQSKSLDGSFPTLQSTNATKLRLNMLGSKMFQTMYQQKPLKPHNQNQPKIQIPPRRPIRHSPRQPRQRLHRHPPPLTPPNKTHQNLHRTSHSPTPTRLVVHRRSHLPRRNSRSIGPTPPIPRTEPRYLLLSIPSRVRTGFCIRDAGTRTEASRDYGRAILFEGEVGKRRGGEEGGFG